MTTPTRAGGTDLMGAATVYESDDIEVVRRGESTAYDTAFCGMFEVNGVSHVTGPKDSVTMAYEAAERARAAIRVEAYLDAQAKLSNLNHEVLHTVGVAGEEHTLYAADIRLLAQHARGKRTV